MMLRFVPAPLKFELSAGFLAISVVLASRDASNMEALRKSGAGLLSEHPVTHTAVQRDYKSFKDVQPNVKTLHDDRPSSAASHEGQK